MDIRQHSDGYQEKSAKKVLPVCVAPFLYNGFFTEEKRNT